MKTIYILIAISILYFSSSAESRASEWEFKVMAYNGNINQYDDDSGRWVEIRFASELQKNDSIKISGKCYLSLVHHSGRTLEIIKEGRYSVKELSNSVDNSGGKSYKALLSNVVKMMQDLNSYMNDEDYRANMGIVSAVERNIDPRIKFNCPDKFNIIGEKLELSWQAFNIDDRKFRFILHYMDGKPKIDEIVNDTAITIDFKEWNLPKGGDYICNVLLKNNEKVLAGAISFKILSESDEEIINKEINSIISDIEELNASDYAIIGLFMQKNKLIFEAAKYFNKSIEMQPDAVEYRILLSNLFR